MKLDSASSVNGSDWLSSSVDSHFKSASRSSEGAPVTQQVLFGPDVGIQLKCKFSLS